MINKIIETERLILRTLHDNDLFSLFIINQDVKVMEYFPNVQSLEDTKKLIDKVKFNFNKYGYSLYAIIRKDTSEFIGFIGLLMADFQAHFTPAIEISWRLSAKHWGQGFATEGAKAVLEYAFIKLNVTEVVSFTAQSNIRSINIMKKIGLNHNQSDDFNHPKLDSTSPLKHHVLFRISRDEYLRLNRRK